jgi:uncharacterized protein YgbK (DUF1537 family)
MSGSQTLFGLIADDLTGACDAGVQFAQRGLRTLVWLSLENPPTSADLLALVTEGRSLAPEAARAAAAAACRRLLSLGRFVLFQKIDSTLRGNPGFEVRGVMEAGGFALALLTPAFPAQGRMVEHGWLRVTGSAESVHVASRLRDQGLASVIEITPEACGRALAEWPSTTATVAVADASTDDDLERLARNWSVLQPKPLPVGSAGLARAIAGVLTGSSGKAVPDRPETPNARQGPVLLVIGSTHDATRAQVEHLQAGGVTVIRPQAMRAARTLLSQGRHALVLLDPARASAAELSALPEVIHESPIGGLVLCGGDTALVVCRTLEAQGIELEGEVSTGIPYGRLVGGTASGLRVVTKAGGFGGREALVEAVEFLSGFPATLQ